MKPSKVNGFYIEENERGLMKYIIPEYYIDSDFDGVDADFALRFMQNELNEIVNSFLNGGFSNAGYVFYPFVKGVSWENMIKIERLRKIASFLNKEGYDFSSCIGKKAPDSKNFAILLSNLYRDWSDIAIKGKKSVKKPKCEEFDIGSYSEKERAFLKPADELRKYAEKLLKPYLLGFYLHGSIATKDYIKGWSDMDTVSIVSKKTLQDPKGILRLRDRLYLSRKFYYQIDPLQHHGSIVIAEHDVENYCQAYFPVEIFKYSKSFFKNDEPIGFKVRDFSHEALKKLFWFVNYFRKLKYEKLYRLNSYDTKNLLHAITLFPTLYLQAKGSSMYKKFSFSRAKEDFDKGLWKVFNDVERIRNNWRGIRSMPFARLFSNINPVLAYQANSLIINIFYDISRKNRVNIKNIIDNMFVFSEQAWNKVKQNAKKRL